MDGELPSRDGLANRPARGNCHRDTGRPAPNRHRSRRRRGLGAGPRALEAGDELLPALEEVLLLRRSRVPAGDPAGPPCERPTIAHPEPADRFVTVGPTIVSVGGLALDPIGVLTRSHEAPGRPLDCAVVALSHHDTPG